MNNNRVADRLGGFIIGFQQWHCPYGLRVGRSGWA
ncbi:hypothetical protein C8N36_11630 [Pelagimonas varians]|uniref:Uncharacterized protein n=1 Tax=Pelagimonas varians TaxID=696760 RepID=A0A238KZP0_9RHOB|nr:hypothetical protein C8N36_11630 [Pelagimonas varians]SMX48285.1 hypothetical protein PEV8663_03798 [Pelagimonas varians]